MEYHTTQLKITCRICGKRLHKAKGRARSYPVSNSIEELAKVFGIDASSDQPDIHPPSFCHSCKCVIRSRGDSIRPVKQGFVWSKHSDPVCSVSNLLLLTSNAKMLWQRYRFVITSGIFKLGGFQ